MNEVAAKLDLERLSTVARRAVEAMDWNALGASAGEILRRDPDSAEGHFLQGLWHKVQKRPSPAVESFQAALRIDPGRYDAAVELANLYSAQRRNAEAARLLAEYEAALSNSPIYLDLAGTVYIDIGMPARAWPLYRKANELQPGVDLFQANLATCAVFLGKIEEAAGIYRNLLRRFPEHRRNHYQLSRLGKARDFSHIDAMRRVLAKADAPEKRNIPLFFAIAKELEDLEQWDEAFEYYQRAGDAVSKVTRHDVAKDIALIDTIIEVCDEKWLADSASDSKVAESGKTPIFVVGLPRTGTTLTERILASHSQVGTVGETMFLQMALRHVAGAGGPQEIDPQVIRKASQGDIGRIANAYMDQIRYRMVDEPMFVEKLPFNFLYLGFIARGWPNARLVHVVRNPMDTCFSMFKQVFTFAYKFSYSLESLGRYYVAHDRLARHWRETLGDRLVEVVYESLVSDPQHQTRLLLERLGLDFEEACLDFDSNAAPSTTASSVQVREKVHTASVQRWRRFERQLHPLREQLEQAGIEVE